MTDDEQFEDITANLSTTSTLYGAMQEARATMHRAHPGGIDVTLIGHEAWRQLTPVQRAQALDELFTAYLVRLSEEERYAQLDTQAATVGTYLQLDDEHVLQDALEPARPIREDTEVDGVCASALANVLDELDLLRHRLAQKGRQ
ncbi:hypothetical protein [Streptomyces sp. Z26]|uniref:hypothetical protein n=1 Tax=Streptomyces sp. Z26 TaxID=2500177 RepID=UPI000EF14749|nr:hypothetical protein [Streptomyces sp. Z26]RLL68163.1 hypothetical protein D7M15_16415 [Streptomyces sp. Z26]